MKIEWASSFRPDGSRCRPPPSTMHGWLAKMRGTLLGNEVLRSKGMKEMRAAQAVRAMRKRRGGRNPRHASTGSNIFSTFSFYMSPSGKPARRSTNPRGALSWPTHRVHQSHRSHTQNMRPSFKSTSRRPTGSGTYRGPASRSRSYNQTHQKRQVHMQSMKLPLKTTTPTSSRARTLFSSHQIRQQIHRIHTQLSLSLKLKSTPPKSSGLRTLVLSHQIRYSLTQSVRPSTLSSGLQTLGSLI